MAAVNRRGFLSLLAPAAALIVAPELLLPKRTFFLPPAGGWADVPMTATEVLARQRAALDALYRAVNPPLLMEDLMIYGTAIAKIEPGAIIRVPPYAWQPLSFVAS